MLKSRTAAVVLPALVMVISGSLARAADDATGTWKWTVTRNDQKTEYTLKLKQEGEKLTGTVARGTQETAIADGKIKDGELSFSVTREGRNNQKMTIKYSGKLNGDVIKGKSEMAATDGGQARPPRDWEAKRSKD